MFKFKLYLTYRIISVYKSICGDYIIRERKNKLYIDLLSFLYLWHINFNIMSSNGGTNGLDSQRKRDRMNPQLKRQLCPSQNQMERQCT